MDGGENIQKNLITTRLLILLVLGGLFFICMSSASAAPSASGDHIYVNGSSGSDSNDGLTPLTAKLTIKNATKTVNNGGTVTISGGTYNGAGNTNIEINHDMTVIGAGKSQTFISGSDKYNIFVVDQNVNFILKNLTVANGKSQYGGGLLNQGHTTVDNSAFTQCTTYYGLMGGGSAIANTDDGTLLVSNTDFLNNDARLSTSAGGTICSNGTLTINNCSFIANRATSGACVFSFKGIITITNSSFINNTAENKGGSLTVYGADGVQIHFCSFIGNTAKNVPTNNIDNTFSNSLNVNSCWWGSNDGPNGIAGAYTADNWIYMVLTSDKSSIKYGKSTTVTADFNNLYDQTTGTVIKLDPAVNHIPDGLIVDFATDIGQITTPGTTQNGLASAVFNGSQVGVATIKATSGDQTSSTTVNVDPLTTTTTVDDANGYPGQTVTLKAQVYDENGDPVNGGYVTFQINDQNIKVQVVNGVATTSWTIPSSWNAGINMIHASYDGTGTIYGDSSARSSILNVIKLPTQIVAKDVTGKVGDKVAINAHLQDNFFKAPIAGQIVTFHINNTDLTGKTDENGDVTVYYIITENPGTFDILITFPGNQQYSDSSYTAKLTVNKMSTKITVNDVTGKHGDKTQLRAVLTDENGNPLGDKTISFSINGEVVGKAVTDSTGTATFTYTIAQTIGSYIITANFLEDDNYTSSTGKGTLTVNPIDTNLTVKDVNGKHGDKVDLKAVLTDENGNLLSGKTVVFYISGKKIGSAITDGTGTATLSYTITQTMGSYQIYANSLADTIYSPSRNLATLTVQQIMTQVTVKNTTVKHGDKANLVAVLTDENGNAIGGKTITFSINGKTIGTATTDSTGTANLYYLANTGNYIVKTIFNGDDIYSGSNGTGNLNVTPWAGLYIKTTVNNTHLKVGEKFTINYKLGNNGPDTAYNVVVSFKIPAGLEFISGTTDSGNWSFDPVTRTLTWTLNNVVVGDPNLKITLKALETGNYTIMPTITANTTTNITQNGTVNINVLKNNNNNTNNTNGTGNNTNHNTKLPTTGLPIAPLIVGLLMVIGGVAAKK